MDRRSFIRFAGFTALAFSTADCGAGGVDARSLAQPELLSALGDGSIRAIGARYRAMSPAEQDVGALRHSINASRPLTERIFGPRNPRIGELVRDDFARGRTVVVEGWLLSVTEARQCALYSLLST
jgi:hypothetical protein